MVRGNRCRVRSAWILCSAVILTLLVAGCAPSEYPALPGIPDELRAVPKALEGLELPELSGIALPGIEELGVLVAPSGGIVFAGPTAPKLAAGERLAGTDITFIGKDGEDALFDIAGMRSSRRIGDSLDFSGSWPGLDGSSYEARLRMYGYTGEGAWLAGVQKLVIPAIEPTPGALPTGAVTLHFPFVDGVHIGAGETISGTTLGYLGKYERGAQILGLPESEYPYRKTGDSINWSGTLRADVGAKYDLRTLIYGKESLRVGGTVAVTLPTR